MSTFTNGQKSRQPKADAQSAATLFLNGLRTITTGTIRQRKPKKPRNRGKSRRKQRHRKRRKHRKKLTLRSL